jgi:hypothetical protein
MRTRLETRLEKINKRKKKQERDMKERGKRQIGRKRKRIQLGERSKHKGRNKK